MNPFRKGAVIAEGAQLAVVVPAGPLHVVADFPSGAIGPIQRGQIAEVRLASFPWTEYGSIRAQVESIASEPGMDGIRVELALTPDQTHRIPLQHGLVGTVAIRVDQISPLHFFLRSLGDESPRGPEAAAEPL